MCFSSQASFAAGALLTMAGIASIKIAKKPSQRAFAAIPLLFAAQQIAEGFIWQEVPVGPNESWNSAAMYTFLFFAQVAWPFWVPFSVWRMEERPGRKRTALTIFCLGTFTSLCLGYFLLRYPVHAYAIGHHILYELDFPPVSLKLGLLYFIPTVVPCLISSVKGIQWVGLGILASFLASRIFFKEELISVWCYFAAIISLLIFFVMRDLTQQQSAKR